MQNHTVSWEGPFSDPEARPERCLELRSPCRGGGWQGTRGARVVGQDPLKGRGPPAEARSAARPQQAAPGATTRRRAWGPTLRRPGPRRRRWEGRPGLSLVAVGEVCSLRPQTRASCTGPRGGRRRGGVPSNPRGNRAVTVPLCVHVCREWPSLHHAHYFVQPDDTL